MNKFLAILSVILISSSVHANCLIDDIGTACNIADFRKPMNTSFGQDTHVPDFSENPNVRLNPQENKITKQLRNFGQSPSDFSYNSNCQFGVCMDTGAPKLFNQRQ